MAITEYEKIIKKVQKQRIQITNKQRIEIANIFADVADDFEAQIRRGNIYSYRVADIDAYAKYLKKQSRYIFKDVNATVIAGITNISRAVTRGQIDFWSNINEQLRDKIVDSLNGVPSNVVNEIVTGSLYKDRKGLDKSIWRAKRIYEHDIDYIVNRGITQRKSALEIAYDLQKYVNPSARKDFAWSKAYPNSSAVVDYNAQRLARTSCTHAYQLSFQRTTKDNPFVEAYQWHSNGSRTCDLCAERDGHIYDKDNVPLDHPNGMCQVTAVITKSYDEIADEIADYVNGGNNPGLSKWLG